MTQTAYPLQTARLLVRMLREDDIDTLTDYRNDPVVNALQDWDLPYPRERVEKLVAAHAGRQDVTPGKGTQLAIDLGGQLIGDIFVGLDEHNGVAEIGFTLAKGHQGKGYGVEAVSAVVDDLVDRVGVHRLVGELSPQNHASARLLERLGMTFEHFAEKSFWWRGAWDDNVHYSMTADGRRDWRARPRGAPGQVRLVELTHENFRDYRRLRTHRSQERFVATVEQSYADALFPEPEQGYPVVPVLRGIECDGEPAGFLMYADAVNEAAPEPYLWRFLIDRQHQGRGIGARALDVLVEDLRAAGHSAVRASWVQGPGGPEPFYVNAGFVLTGEIEDGEVVGRRSS
ncbi:GNAT family N-acetyltransferase [Ornithinimicrobium pratense]|uniref:GNAT family N-acetyltransferase n=1 Tax=Ornithinimicrobium pratense TaxID=2593973 RepID=A0A5J6V662_9MICO|nr:GNAT family N-acetyltransferase [Ornithinimicrobium pratense]QFG68523.1 GNAT family N-acetyltransferase [Ornithinimicrobium pratense]